MNTPTTSPAIRNRVSTGTPWEPLAGYSRAIRVGNTIEVSGTTAIQNGEVMGKGDPYVQTQLILQIIARALEQLGARMADVVRTRIYVKDISQWEAIGKAHGEVFASIRPACSMLEVKALIDPEILVEIEATAIISA